MLLLDGTSVTKTVYDLVAQHDGEPQTTKDAPENDGLRARECPMKKLAMSSLVIYFAIVPARAQVTVDFAQITCEQYRLYTVMNPREIAIWLNGYYRGRRNIGTVVNVQEFKDNIFKLDEACASKTNYKLPIMQVVEKLLAGKNQ